MGSTNTGCALTGLEIVEGEPAYLTMIHKDPIEYEGHWITVPPLLGTYTGFGDIILTEDVACLGLSRGDSWPSADSDHHHDTDRAIFLHPGILDELEHIPMDDEEKFGEATGERMRGLRDSVEAQKQEFAAKSIDADPEIVNGIIAARALQMQPRGTWIGAIPALSDTLEDETLFDSFVELNSRAVILTLASSELRRPLVPTDWGAQETQDDARIAVYELAANIARSRSEDPDE